MLYRLFLRGPHYVVKVGDYLFTIPLVVEKNLTVTKVRRENELLRHELEGALLKLREKNEQLEHSLRRVEEVAATDPLTGLYNRRHFGRVLEQLFSEAQRYDKDASCVMVDLDAFKQLNDTYHHQTGDQIIALAARAIAANMRKMDVAARYGGDEFILLLPHASGAEAAGVAARIRDEYRQSTAALLKRPTPRQGLTMSIGISSMLADRPASSETLIARADGALYRAKQEGRDRIALATPAVAEPAFAAVAVVAAAMPPPVAA